MKNSNYNKGIGKAEHNKILHMLARKLADTDEVVFDSIEDYIYEYDLQDSCELTGNRNHSNDYYDEIEMVFEIEEDLGISFWWIECIPHNETVVDNWKFDETLVKLVKPVKVEKIEWQPIIID